MAFEAWAFPWAFRLGERETASLGDDADPPLTYPFLSPERLTDLTGSLRRARDKLLEIPVSGILLAVDRVACRLLDSRDPLRQEALDGLEAHGGYSAPMALEILDRMARDWTRPPLEALLHAEFSNPEVLDGFRPSVTGGEVRASGPPLAFHLGAGTVPGVVTTSMIRSLLVKSAVLVKPGRGDVVLPVLFARALHEQDAEVGDAVAVAYWPRAEGRETETALRASDLAVVYGGDETVSWVRSRTPSTTHLREYRHRIGVGIVGRQALLENLPGELAAAGLSVSARETALAAARAVAMFDQRGCVCPHAYLVEEGGETDPETWAELLAEALAGLEQELPAGTLSPEDGAALQQVRGEAEMEESQGRGRVFHGGASAPWTVIYRSGGTVVPSCLNRTVQVIPVGELREVFDVLSPFSSHLQTVGVAGPGPRRTELLEGLARIGVTRIVDLTRIPWPAPWWHHDGSGPLRALIRWTDAEGI